MGNQRGECYVSNMEKQNKGSTSDKQNRGQSYQKANIEDQTSDNYNIRYVVRGTNSERLLAKLSPFIIDKALLYVSRLKQKPVDIHTITKLGSWIVHDKSWLPI